MLRTSISPVPRFGLVYKVPVTDAIQTEEKAKNTVEDIYLGERGNVMEAFYEVDTDHFYVCTGNTDAKNCKDAKKAGFAVSQTDEHSLPKAWTGMTLKAAKQKKHQIFEDLKRHPIEVSVSP